MKMKSRTRYVPALLAALAAGGCGGRLPEYDILDRLGERGVPPLVPEASASDAESPASGRALPEKDITLTDLLRSAELVNPELQSARSAVGVAAGRTWQARLYPNPAIGVRAEDIGFRGDSVDTVVGVTQPIVIGGRLRAAGEAMDAEEAVRLAEINRIRREVFGRIAGYHARVLDLAAQIALADELLHLAEQTLSIAEERFAARAVSEPDVIRPRVEVAQLRADRRRLVRELEAAERQLGLELGTAPIGAGRLAAGVELDPEPLDEESLRSAVAAGHPALLASEREIRAAEAELERVRAERVPDLEIGAGVGYGEERDQGFLEFGVAAEIPVWDRRQGDLLAARYEIMRRRQALAARRNSLLSRLAEELGAYSAARDELAVLRESVAPDAERAFRQIDEAYRAGRASFLDLLDAQRTLMQSRRTLVELAGIASAAKARVAAIAGTELLAREGGRLDVHPESELQAAPDGAEDVR